MIPFFASQNHSPMSFEPPTWFRPAEQVWDVRLIPYPERSTRSSAAQKAGIKYEASFHKLMANQYPCDYSTFRDQMFTFQTPKGPRWCKPDGLLLFPGGGAILFEVKYRHTSDSWWQLWKLYRPVVASFYGIEPICCEVCKFFDPRIEYPGPITRRSSLALLGLPGQSPPGPGETLVIDGWEG